jgi:heat shock protein HtpX
MRTLKVFVLMAALTALIVGAGQMIGGTNGAVTALALAALMNFAAYFWSDRMVLRMYRARTVTEPEAPELYRMVDRLRQAAGLPMPIVALAPHDQPNAFATGRSPAHAVVCVTQGLLRVVSRDELEGVIAHELAHIQNRDMLISTVAATLAGAITYLAYFAMFFGGRDNRNPVAGLALLIIGPLAAGMIQMAISRQREFEADRVGAAICGKPLALASALAKLETHARRVPLDVNPAAAPLAQVNPLAARGGGGINKLFSTHPPIAERIAKLEDMARGR